MNIEHQGKKLYIVKVEYEAYVLAEDNEAAEEFADEITRTENPSVRSISVVDKNPNPLGWSSASLVYHDDSEKDISLWKIIGV